MFRRSATIVLAAAAAIALGVPTSASAATDLHHGPGPGPSPSTTTVSYAASDAVIANPERGFDHTTETHYRADGSGYTPLDLATLRSYRADGITQIVRVFYMEKFANQAQLDPAWLRLVQRDYDTARQAGVGVITRFAYVQGGDYPYSAPYGDADLPTVLGHIRQLTPILRRNADVIPTLQEGFIGLWGEGYYTDHFASDPTNPGVLTDADQAARRQVLQAELAALPSSRSVQVRTMAMKQAALGVPSGTAGALTPAEAHDGSAKSRIGHHNDCFLASPDDFGTFLTDPLSLDQDYLAADSRYVPVGGETCAVDAPRSEFPSASAEMAKYHYSYLNSDYNQDVLNTWGTAGLTETAKRLGYRFTMTSSTVENRGRTPSVSVSVRNDGWAAPYNARPVDLVLTNGRRSVTVPVRTDVRSWQPGQTVTVAAQLPHLSRGSWSVSLALPAAERSVSGDPDFAIQTANVGTWDARTGLNRLNQTVTVR
ncbi:DUF4832 domain-containing protein [Curtobacterium sp. Leaf261]|uniref:DUF4832 domain-containing protein n=1 Tax=Curtobacterium sp. Leaf261 TaxID=1736311 RepID=UPI0006F33356|nr:DUF4832 domain-containing protein [Curtobacterium sp. Leaf261]KQO60334.1 hypothetical protein ASF23_13995 [Curtobacterium sp. Leaf261]